MDRAINCHMHAPMGSLSSPRKSYPGGKLSSQETPEACGNTICNGAISSSAICKTGHGTGNPGKRKAGE